MRKLILPIALLTAVLLIVSCTGRHLALNEFNFFCIVFHNSYRTYELTLENILNRSSSHVVSGTVTGVETDSVDRDLAYYSFEVDSVIIGELEADDIILLDWTSLLEVGQEYLLFLRIHERTHWQFTAYSFHAFFVLLIDEDQQLWRLEDPTRGKAIPPFVDDKYNDFATLSGYIQRVRNQGLYNIHQRLYNPPVHFIESVDSLEELYELSDLVMDIHVIIVNRRNEQTASVQFNQPRNVYKGTPPKGNNLILPGDTTTGRYLVFLTRTRSGWLQLTTRQGSLVPIDSPEYDDVLQWLEQKSKP